MGSKSYSAAQKITYVFGDSSPLKQHAHKTGCVRLVVCVCVGGGVLFAQEKTSVENHLTRAPWSTDDLQSIHPPVSELVYLSSTVKLSPWISEFNRALLVGRTHPQEHEGSVHLTS